MEVDEVESGLLRQFNCLSTTDKEVLVKQMQDLVGINFNDVARFYLDMSDWNLQAAICAYFDLQTTNKLPKMMFIKDITIGEGESVPPNTKFVKTWQIHNSGDDAWPFGCQLIFAGGDRLDAPEKVLVLPLEAGQVFNLSVEMKSPEKMGLYSSKWRMSTAQGNYFGDAIWVILQVDDGGTLALMQQMSNLNELGSPSRDNVLTNPFGPLNIASEYEKAPGDSLIDSDSLCSNMDADGDRAMS